MSQLGPFVRAFRALGRSFEAEHNTARELASLEANVEAKASLLHCATLTLALGQGFLRASANLEQQIAQDLSRVGPLEPRPPEA